MFNNRPMTFEDCQRNTAMSLKSEDRNAKYMPTPEEIAEECAKLRATWSKRTERERRVVKSVEVETPSFRIRLPEVSYPRQAS